MDDLTVAAPSIDEVRQLQERLAAWLIRTPVVRCMNLEHAVGDNTEIWGKLEFLQQTGTFKPRGALSVVLDLSKSQRQFGITAVSAGNHAIAAAFAASVVGTSAKVVMLRAANPARVAACKSYGAEIVFCEDVHEAFAVAEEIQQSEGRFLVHPFEGEKVVKGTATLGMEICEQVKALDALICPVGGGGLCAGVASAVKQLHPECEIFGVEPEGAKSMHFSFASGRPESAGQVETIADSLGAPFAMPYTFELCRQNVDELVTISDSEMREAMQILFSKMKFAVEPACAASTAALLGPLQERLAGKKVALLFCGSNIDFATYSDLIALG